MGRVLKLALATAALGLATSPAFAQSANINGVTINTGQNTTVHFGGPAGSTASADLYLQLTGATNGVFNFNYTFTNTNASVSNLTGFGFQTNPTLLGISGTGMSFVLNPINFPGGYDVDACAYAGNNCDAANNQGDLFSGTFALTFASGTTAIALTDLVDRYASLTQLNNISGEGTPVRGVPEPATWAMMLVGFGGIGMAMRRKQRRNGALMQVA